MNASLPDHSRDHDEIRYREALDYLYGRIDYENSNGNQTRHPFRLERTCELFLELGLGEYLHAHAVQPKVPLIHIAGTKGKGSTATMVSQILTSAGKRVGLYTSPHLTDLEERFRIDGIPCSRDELIDLVDTIRPAVKTLRGGVSFFELTTAMAILHFDRQACDAIVLEVGLGGRLDSTNVCASSVMAVTSIGLDHQRVLGDTIAEIAAEKAGIIKSPRPVVSGAVQSDAQHAIQQAALASNAILFQRGEAFESIDHQAVEGGMQFTFVAKRSLSCEPVPRLPASTSEDVDRFNAFVSLDGSHQVENASLAIALVRLLAHPAAGSGLHITDDQILAGLASTRCIGRMERFEVSLVVESVPNRKVDLLIDTAHNHDSMVALRRTLELRLLREGNSAPADRLQCPLVVVMGTSRDKDVEAMAAEVVSLADAIICTQYTTNPRATSPGELFDVVVRQANRSIANHSKRPVIKQVDAPELALELAMDLLPAACNAGTIVVCGSFFLAGQLRPLAMQWAQSGQWAESGTPPIDVATVKKVNQG